jgi:hypothetical protein
MRFSNLPRVIFKFLVGLFSSKEKKKEQENITIDISSDARVHPSNQLDVDRSIFISKDQAIDVCVRISGDFEGNSGYSGVVGNFDKMGITCGVLGWPWGLGNQQRLISKLVSKDGGKEVIRRHMPTIGMEYLNLSEMPVRKSLSIVSSWSSGAKVREPYLSELKALWGSPEMIEVQREQSEPIFNSAVKYSKAWLGYFNHSGHPPLWVIAYFFDIVVMNGSLRGILPDDVQQFMDDNGGHSEIEMIFSFCSSANSTMAAYKDCKKNALHWRTEYGPILMSSDESFSIERFLFVLGYMRSMRANYTYRAATLNRRGIMALGSGYTESELKILKNTFKNYKNTLVAV